MANNDDIKGGPHEMHCAFCGKSRSQVDKLIQGPNGICICDECISTAAEMLSGTPYAIDYDDEPAADVELKHLPTPHEIYDELSQYVMGQEAAKRASVCASSVLPVPVGPSSRMLLLASSTSSSSSGVSSPVEMMRR